VPTANVAPPQFLSAVEEISSWASMTGEAGLPQSDKQAIRREARRERCVLHGLWGATAGLRLAEAFLSAFPAVLGQKVAGYWPIGDEIDTRPLLRQLQAAGAALALPVVRGPDQALIFRLWLPGMALEAGPHGTFHPPASADEVRPELVLLPLLAFDRQGTRLGYGGGYYDRTLDHLRASGSLLAVGIAFAGQERPVLPKADHDQLLDWIVTEQGALEIGR